MKSEEITESNSKNSEIELLNIKLKRTMDGAKLYLKSEHFENFFKNRMIDNGYTIKNRDGTLVKFYSCPNFSDRDVQRKINQCEPLLRNYDGFINAGVLRTVGLSSGIVIDVNGVYNKKALTTYMNELKLFARDFFLEYLCEDDLTVQIVIRGNEK